MVTGTTSSYGSEIENNAVTGRSAWRRHSRAKGAPPSREVHPRKPQ
ncbi:hypothetical protein AB0A63_32135 [Lentzea sp. NPDC042327]